MNDFIITVISYAFVFFATLFFINLLTKGFIFSYIRVLMSRGSKILVHISGLDHYYIAGSLSGSNVLIVDREVKSTKGVKNKRVSLKEAYIYKLMLVSCVNYDELNNVILKPHNLEAAVSVDPIKTEELIERALYSPDPDVAEELQKKMIIQTVVILAAIVMVGFLLRNEITNLKALISSIKEVPIKGVVTAFLPLGGLKKWLK